jgi:Lrp/AsnC family transcriptional regulator for asnA, asnC and gidA
LNSQPKIDKVDVKILKALLQDPRTSFAQIAKDCERSTNAIRMRFKRLNKDGVITGAIMQVNPKSLGYDCVAQLGIQADVNEEINVLEFLEKIPSVIWSNQQIGKYNLVSFLALKNVDEIAHMAEHVKNHPNVLDVEVGIWVDVVQMDRPENLVIEPADGSPHISELTAKDEKVKPKIIHSPVVSDLAEKKDSTASHELDKTDLLIIRILSENAFMSFRKVAEKLAISTQAVIRRYNRLKKDVLAYSSITVNLEKLGYVGYAILGVRISSHHNISNIFERIIQVPNIITAFRVLGAVNVVVGVPFANIEQLFKVYQEVAKIPGVTQIDLFLHKQSSIWPLNIFSKLISNLLQKT